MFGIDFKQTRTNVVGKDGSPFEVSNVLMSGVAFVAQIAGTVALVVSLTPLFFMSWGDSRMLAVMFVTFCSVFAVSFFMMGKIGLYLYRNAFPLQRDDKGRFVSAKTAIPVKDNGKLRGYLVNGRMIPAEKIDNLDS